MSKEVEVEHVGVEHVEVEHVIMQLEHDRKKLLPVRLDWLMESEKIRETLKKSKKYQEPIFFYYHNVQTSSPSFSLSMYTKKFDPEKAACYKGYISNNIYDSLAAATNAMQHKRIPMASRTKSTVKSEAELEKKTKEVRRKRNKELQILQKSAKAVNSSYVVDALMKLGSGKSIPPQQNKSNSPSSDIDNSSKLQKPPISVQNVNSKSSEISMDQPNPSQNGGSSDIDNSSKLQKPIPVQNVNFKSSEISMDQPNPSQNGGSSDIDNSSKLQKPPIPVQNVNSKSSEISMDQQNPSQNGGASDIDNSSKLQKPIPVQNVNSKSSEISMDQPNPSQNGGSSDINNSSKLQTPIPAQNVNSKSSDQSAISTASMSIKNTKPKENGKTKRKPSNIQPKENQKQQIIVDDEDDDDEDEEEEEDCSSHTSDSSELILLKKRLNQKNNGMKKLKARCEKLERNGDIWRELNVQLQQKLIFCKCKTVEKEVDAPIACKEMYNFDAKQLLLLAAHVLPEDINKYVVDMATFLFTPEDLAFKTAAKLERSKISFMSRYLQQKEGFFISEPGIKEVLNKKRLNSLRGGTNSPVKNDVNDR